MVLSKEIAHLENSAVKLTITIPKDEVLAQYGGLLADYSKNIQIPGFRKGKVPREVLERKFGDALKDEAMGRIMEKGVQEIFEAEDFPEDARPLPYSTPQVQDEPKLDLGQDLVFSVQYDVLPKVDVKDWKGIEIEVPDVKVEDEDISRELEAVRERNALVIDKDDSAPAAKDDVVTVDYTELGEDGQPVSGGERQDYVFTLGTGMNVFKFDDEVTGMKKGETKEFDKTYADDFDDPVLAGKTKKIKVTLKAVKEKKLPDLDDDLAQDVNEKFNTLDDLKKNIRERLEKNLDNRTRELKINNLLEKILEKTEVIVPESMMRIELESRWRNLARQFNTSTEQLMKMLGASGKGIDEIQDEWRPDAKKALQSRLIVETLMRDMGLEASDEDVEKEFETMAAGMDTSAEEIRKYYEQGSMKEYLKEDIKEKKLFEIMLGETKIKKGKKQKYLDLMGNNG
ncbi:trigger factor [Breznakiella homolactica]|uniref:Trigger factor n=1 Tax=Breznakiella homolactica TaxID=2798577 RepID=A0A7T7XJF2_9SPIR|nr:trigger factor [Breznakiella homolactica]QQO07515.1 trigger factor [Breznakiella homolactica]